MTNNPIRRVTHIPIPIKIWERTDISTNAKVLWAQLDSLHDEKFGGCYASDEYHMKFLNIKRRQLYVIYKELKDAGLMEVIHNHKDKVVRRAIDLNNQEECTKLHSSAQKCTESVHKNALSPIIYEDYKSPPYNPPPPGGDAAKAAVCFEKFGSHIKLKSGEYSKLEAALTKPILDQIIEELNDYCAANKPKGYSDYAAAIRNWARRRPKTISPSKASEIQDKELAIKIKTLHQNNNLIILGYDYLEFVFSPMQITHLKFGSSAFKEQAINALRKLNLSREGL